MPATALVVLGPASLVPAPLAYAGAATCQGLPVTVVGAVGTEDDDVMRAPLDADTPVEGLGGDDTICLVDGTEPGSRDPRFSANAGPGDDTVSYEVTYSATVHLGAGSDRFIGNEVGAAVYTGAYAPTSYLDQVDTEADVVLAGDGADRIYSGDPAGIATNADRISTGGGSTGPDKVFYAGRMTSEGALDNGASDDLLYWAGAWPAGTLTIDNAAGRATLVDREVLRWTGVASFLVDERPESLRFVGGPGPDALTVGDSYLPAPGGPMTVDIATRGGADRVELAGALRGRVRTGGGVDDLWLGGGCERTRARLGAWLECTRAGQRSRTVLAGIDRLEIRGRHVVAIGTSTRDVMTVRARTGRIEGRGGADVLEAFAGAVVVDGGSGRDRCRAKVRRSCER